MSSAEEAENCHRQTDGHTDNEDVIPMCQPAGTSGTVMGLDGLSRVSKDLFNLVWVIYSSVVNRSENY